MERLVKIRSCDDKLMEVPETVATRATLIKNVMELTGDDPAIPIPLATAEILEKVFEYCTKHAEFEAAGDRTESDLAAAKLDLERWDHSFLNVPVNTLYDISTVANFMVVEDLLDSCCQKIASMIRGKSVEEIRKLFNIENDFTPEEEAEIREENSWALL
ncbi:SKP1-like protein 1B [Ananas comosus]|uniref:SKP1-like protein n=1 Tax=Ananas comosus TaxID=4615 RepID=A0A199W2B3_ANACO|nr:SKP1-like protein 1B [Ananas comosus]OAY83449.1 SKP1-like protein 4 [Ananas comosus]